MFLYKKWNFIILLNNLIINYFSIVYKTVKYLNFDIYKYYFFNYNKITKFVNLRVLNMKKKINFPFQ